MSITTELDRRAERLNARAQALGDALITETFIEMVVYLRRQHGSPEGYNSENQRIRNVMDRIKSDFHDILDKKGQRTSEEQLKHRLFLVSLGFVYTLFNASVVEIAIIKGIPMIRWNNTIIPPWPCETCEELAGLYSVFEKIPDIDLIPNVGVS